MGNRFGGTRGQGAAYDRRFAEGGNLHPQDKRRKEDKVPFPGPPYILVNVTDRNGGESMRRVKCGLKAQHAVCFGLGLILSCFCPTGLILFMAAVIIVALGLALIRS